MRAALGRLQHGDYEAAAEAARRCFQANPNWSYYPHAACGDARETWKDRRGQRVGAAGSEAATGYSITGMCDALGLHASIAKAPFRGSPHGWLTDVAGSTDTRLQRPPLLGCLKLSLAASCSSSGNSLRGSRSQLRSVLLCVCTGSPMRSILSTFAAKAVSRLSPSSRARSCPTHMRMPKPKPTCPPSLRVTLKSSGFSHRRGSRLAEATKTISFVLGEILTPAISAPCSWVVRNSDCSGLSRRTASSKAARARLWSFLSICH